MDYYFIRQFLSFFTKALSRDDWRRSAGRCFSFPSVGVHVTYFRSVYCS